MAKIVVVFPLWKSVEHLWEDVFIAETPEGDIFVIASERQVHDDSADNPQD